MKKKIAIITGASSGIGQEFAFQLDEIMHELDEIWLIARRRERLEELAKVLETGCRTIAMDVFRRLCGNMERIWNCSAIFLQRRTSLSVCW